MAKNYRQLTKSIRERINPENLTITKAFSEELSTISYSDVLTYIRIAMKGVEPEYTRKSKEAGERVKQHLENALTNVSFEYQGSVMTNTHIKGNSDIDLLTICEKFYSYDFATITAILQTPEKRANYYQSTLNKLQEEINSAPYLGNALNDLRSLRLDSENILSNTYAICDCTKPKSIKIKNSSLNREVDIVIANWYDDVTSIIRDRGEFRGIQIYNKDQHIKEKPDFPFLSINRINAKSSETKGRLKKMIRFLKNSKVNSDHDINLSSFDINAICYDIDTSAYEDASFFELVPVIYNQMKSICTNREKADSIVSVDGKESIFKYNNTKIQDLKLLLSEVESMLFDLNDEIRA